MQIDQESDECVCQGECAECVRLSISPLGWSEVPLFVLGMELNRFGTQLRTPGFSSRRRPGVVSVGRSQ